MQINVVLLHKTSIKRNTLYKLMFLDTQDGQYQTCKWDQGQPAQNHLSVATKVQWMSLEVQVATHIAEMLTWNLHVTCEHLKSYTLA